MDERFILHRLYSTRFSMLIGLIAMFIWFNIEMFKNDTLRWDIFYFILIFAVSKVGAMIYFKLTN